MAYRFNNGILTKVFKVLLLALIISTSYYCSNNQKPVVTKEYQSNWKSLSEYDCPEWFRDAKFGIWAHSSPQDVAMFGDWYAKNMYEKNHPAFQHHLEKFGHPSEHGYKDLCNAWTLESWNPDELIKLYKSAGAKYFVALANHHCNFDTWNSEYQEWNSVNIGPKRDVVGEWQKATQKHGLKFGVSVHNINSYGWFLSAFGADTSGPYKGVPYDANLTKADGKGTWWEGYDPATLYGPKYKENDTIPPLEIVQNWYDRTKHLVDTYRPDLLYFDSYIIEQVWRQFTYHGDDTYLGVPLATKKIAEKTPFKEAGIDIISYFYNENQKWHNGEQNAVLNIKVHDLNETVPECYKKGMVIDREKGGFGGGEAEIQKYPWQKDRPFGSWHYNERVNYPTTESVIWNLVDVVSKNGNFLLGIPMKPDGTLAEEEYQFLEEMGTWMDINGEAIYETRPWKVYGENGGIRYTQKDDILYAIIRNNNETGISLYKVNNVNVKHIELLGSQDSISWHQDEVGVHVVLPNVPEQNAIFSLKIKL